LHGSIPIFIVDRDFIQELGTTFSTNQYKEITDMAEGFEHCSYGKEISLHDTT